MTNKLMCMNLQYFSEGGEVSKEISGENISSDNHEKDVRATNETLSLTQNDLDSQIGKAVAKALENSDKKWQSKLAAEIEQAKTDAIAYVQMSEKEKQAVEFAARENQITEREQAIHDREMLANIKSDLQDNQLPLAFGESLLMMQDSEKIQQAIQDIKTMWDQQLAATLKVSVRQPTPQSGSATVSMFKNKQVDIVKKARAKRLVK